MFPCILISKGSACKFVIVNIGIKCILSKSFKLNKHLLNSKRRRKLYPKPQVVQASLNRCRRPFPAETRVLVDSVEEWPKPCCFDQLLSNQSTELSSQEGCSAARNAPAPSGYQVSEVEGGVAGFSKAFSYPPPFNGVSLGVQKPLGLVLGSGG